MEKENNDFNSEATLRIVACEHSIVTETFSPKNVLIKSPNVVSDGGVSFQGNHTTQFIDSFQAKHLELSAYSDEKVYRVTSDDKFKKLITSDKSYGEHVATFKNSAC